MQKNSGRFTGLGGAALFPPPRPPKKNACVGATDSLPIMLFSSPDCVVPLSVSFSFFPDVGPVVLCLNGPVGAGARARAGAGGGIGRTAKDWRTSGSGGRRPSRADLENIELVETNLMNVSFYLKQKNLTSSSHGEK